MCWIALVKRKLALARSDETILAHLAEGQTIRFRIGPRSFNVLFLGCLLTYIALFKFGRHWAAIPMMAIALVSFFIWHRVRLDLSSETITVQNLIQSHSFDLSDPNVQFEFSDYNFKILDEGRDPIRVWAVDGYANVVGFWITIKYKTLKSVLDGLNRHAQGS